MAEARGFHTATLLDDGRVLVAGGFIQFRVLSGAEVYDPHSDTWAPTGGLLTARAGHAAVRLGDGRVLVAGGQGSDSQGHPIFLDSAEVYDPATGLWSPTGSMAVARAEPVLTLLNNGKVFVAGNTGAPGPLGTSAEIYDPATGQWSRAADMNTARSDHIQVLLDDGRVLVAGGFAGAEPGEVYHASAEIYNPRSDTWTTTGSMTMARSDAEALVLDDGRVLVSGGNTSLQPPARTNTAEIYDPESGSWTRTAGAMSDAKIGHTMTLLRHGQVLVAGGFRAEDTALVSADLYDPRSDTWTPTASLAKARGGHAAVLLEHDQVLVIGGLNFDPDTSPAHALASTEIFEPGKGHPHKGHSHSIVFPDAFSGIAVGVDPAGNLASTDGFTASGFLGSIAAALTASAGHPKTPAITPILASPPRPVAEMADTSATGTGAAPASLDVPGVAAAAASDALFADSGDDF